MRRHSTSTLMGLTKKELVEYVRMAEHNQEVAEESLKQQAENVKDWSPVRHGQWTKDHDGDEYCSVCSRYMPIREVTGDPSATNYCPNCGSKMYVEE